MAGRGGGPRFYDRETVPPPARGRRARPRRRGGGGRRRRRSDLGARVLAAIPALAFAIFIVAAGGIVFALGLVLLGVVALGELYTLMARAGPVRLAGFLTVAAMILAAHFGEQFDILLVLALSFPATFLLAVARPRRRDIAWAVAATMFGSLWIGLALSHAVLLRELDHGGALVLDVLIGTFVGDSVAYFGGRTYGRRPLAPWISPHKTVEGLLCGIAGGTFAFWLFAFAYQDWFPGSAALAIGFMVALAAPVGDLFESLVKRSFGVKDTGRFFGAHGGALDRLDAVLFTAVAGYYGSVWLL